MSRGAPPSPAVGARERVRLQQEAAQRRERRRRSLVISGGLAVAATLVLVVALVLSAARAEAPAAVVSPQGVTEAGGIVAGDPAAPVEVVVYLDYQCPACRAFEEAVGPYLAEQRAAGAVSVEHRPIAILDRLSSGTAYSTRAANAAACLAGSGGDVAAFSAALYAQQPPEGGSGLPDEVLVATARDAGAEEGVAACITGQDHRAWVAAATDAATSPVEDGGAGVLGTPTVLVDGEVVEASLPAVRAAVEAAA